MTAIHHPSGDVKKISFNTDGIDDAGNFWNVVQWDIGLVEPGSSGGALFDENHLIIGQLFAGDLNIGCANGGGLVDNTTYGKFDVSWDGDGTNATRLSNWLGGVNNPTELPSLLIPVVEGSDFLCTSAKTYSLLNPIPGYAVSWEAVPSSLLGSPTSGAGTEAILWAAGQNSTGSVTLTFTLTSADCGDQVFTKTVWVGKPAAPVIISPECFVPGTDVTIMAQTQGATSISWSFPDCPYGPPIGDPDPKCWFNYTGNYQQIFIYVGQQSGSISVWASNECGTSSTNLPIVFCEGVPGPPPGDGTIIRSTSNDPPNDRTEQGGEGAIQKVKVYPNPANNALTVELDQNFYPLSESKDVQLLDINGRPVSRKTTTANTLRIGLESIPSGIYYLKIRYSKGTAFQKVVVI